MDDKTLEASIIEQGKQIAELNINMRAAFRRIDEQKALTVTVQELAYSVRDMGRSITTLQADVAEIKDKPAKRWETIIGALITSTVAFLIGKFL